MSWNAQMPMQVVFPAAIVGIVMFTIAGCGHSTSLSGKITYDDRPVQKGSIAFQPADGQGPTAGSPIMDGKYCIKNILPGKKVVHIVGLKNVDMPHSSEEMAQKVRSASLGFIPADEIPRGAPGNDSVVELGSGQQIMDFHVKKPATH